MFLLHKTEGFIFKKQDQLEADRIFSVFTKDLGRIEILGRAIRKIASKLKSGMEIFYLSKIEFIQSEHRKTLKDVVLVEKFKNIEENPEKFKIACKIANLLDCFVKGQEKDERILELTVDVFRKINNFSMTGDDYWLTYYYFLWNLISLLGYGPELKECAVCQKDLNPAELYFSNEEGGVICKYCMIPKKDGIKISPNAVKVLRLILKKEWDILKKLKTDKESQKTLREISKNYYLYLTPLFNY